MQNIDPKTLFSIFEAGDEEVYKEHGVQDTLNNPFVLINMVIRGVSNYHIMDMMYMRQYPKHYKSVREITKRKYFNNLYQYLTRIKVNELNSDFTIGESFELHEGFYSLNTLRKYYEQYEEYEKCAVIKKFIDLLDNQ